MVTDLIYETVVFFIFIHKPFLFPAHERGLIILSLVSFSETLIQNCYITSLTYHA